MTDHSKPDPKPGASGRKGFDWKGCLIESLIVFTVFNIIAAIVTWYFIMPRLNR